MTSVTGGSTAQTVRYFAYCTGHCRVCSAMIDIEIELVRTMQVSRYHPSPYPPTHYHYRLGSLELNPAEPEGEALCE